MWPGSPTGRQAGDSTSRRSRRRRAADSVSEVSTTDRSPDSMAARTNSTRSSMWPLTTREQSARPHRADHPSNDGRRPAPTNSSHGASPTSTIASRKSFRQSPSQSPSIARCGSISRCSVGTRPRTFTSTARGLQAQTTRTERRQDSPIDTHGMFPMSHRATVTHKGTQPRRPDDRAARGGPSPAMPGEGHSHDAHRHHR